MLVVLENLSNMSWSDVSSCLGFGLSVLNTICLWPIASVFSTKLKPWKSLYCTCLFVVVLFACLVVFL